MSNGPFVPTERKEGGEDGEPQPPKITSLRLGGKLAEVVPKPTVATRLDAAQTQNGRVLKSPLESPPLTPGGDRKLGLGCAVRRDLTFPLPPAPCRALGTPRARGTGSPAAATPPRPRRQSEESVGATTLSHRELRPLRSAGGGPRETPSARPPLPRAPNLLLERISPGSSC